MTPALDFTTAAQETLLGLSNPRRERLVLELECCLRAQPVPASGTGHFHAGGMCVVAERMGQREAGGTRVVYLSPQCTLDGNSVVPS